MSRRPHRGVRIFRVLVLAAALFLPGAAALAQTTVVLDAPDSEVWDAVVRGGSHANDNINGRTLITRASSENEFVRRTLLKFDTQNRVPYKATIQSAKLTLTVKGGNSATRTLNAYRVARSFEENQTTWRRRKGTLYWTHGGGDLGAKYASATVTDTVGSKISFNVTALVQATVNGNFGSRYTRIAILDPGVESLASYKEYYSSEASDPSVRPRLTVAYGGSSGTTTSPPPPTSGTLLRIVHWNLHHGVGTDGDYDIQRIATWIAKMKPDLVSLNEVEKYTGWGDEDQPARYEQMLESKTGRTWYRVWAQEYGNWSANGKGNLLLSRFPLGATARRSLSYDRTVALGQVTVNGRNITFMTTHLDPDSGGRRFTQAKELVGWADNYAENRIIAGDMNAQPTSTEMNYIKNTYYDAWARAKSLGIAFSAPDNPYGYTRHSRIDYIFSSKTARNLVLKKVEVVDCRDSSGKMPSDHRPILAVYEVR
jgi:endonuclease/exonuclease/phosphatase family metal-dependent hydrolase